MSHSLKGLRILNTRPQRQAHQLSKKIHEAGGIVIELPALELKATPIQWINSLPALKNIDQAIFISANSVRYCFSALNQNHIEWLSSIKVIAIGQATALALQEFNIQVNAIPDVPDSEHVLALNTFLQPKKQNVLLFKGEGGRLLLEEQLKIRGINLFIFKVYYRRMPKICTQLIKSLWKDDKVDIILLTSEQSLHHLFQMFDKEAHDWLRTKIWLVISERLAKIASSSGIHNILISHPDRLVNTLLDCVNKD